MGGGSDKVWYESADHEANRLQFDQMRGKSKVKLKGSKDPKSVWAQYNPTPDATDGMLQSLLAATGSPTGTSRKSTFQTLLGGG